jgi:hypothetical protein
VAHATGHDDDQTAAANGPVHQWLTYNAFLLYNSQFAGSELTQFIGDWQDYGRKHHRTNGDNNDVIEGVFDEDVSGPIFLYNGFHRDIMPQNPLGQSVPYEQHFVAGVTATRSTRLKRTPAVTQLSAITAGALELLRG